VLCHQSTNGGGDLSCGPIGATPLFLVKTLHSYSNRLRFDGVVMRSKVLCHRVYVKGDAEGVWSGSSALVQVLLSVAR